MSVRSQNQKSLRLCATVLKIFLPLAAAAGGAGEYTANRLPGTNLVWTAGRVAAEIAAEAALRVDGTNALAESIAAGTNALHAEAASALALAAEGTNAAATANALGVTATNAAAQANALAVTATNTAAAAEAKAGAAETLARSATNTAATALALGVTATNAAAGANALAGTATNTAATALALGVTATNDAANAVYQAGIAYLFATNAAAQVEGVYTPATNAAAVAALAWSRANLAYTMAGAVYGYSTNAIDIATNAAAQVATAYPAATNALAQATNATAVSAAAYVLASNAWDTATNAYDIATNAQQRAGYLETNAATKAELGNYETVQDAQIVAAVALDAQTLAESAVPTNHPRWLAALTNETDALALASLAGYKPSALWEGTNFYMVIEGNTNLVFYSIVTAQTNYTVTLSDNFEETVGHTRPAWTNNVFPFTNGTWLADGSWAGIFKFDTDPTFIIFEDGADSQWSSISEENFPMLLVPEGLCQGTATVSIASIVYPTNELYRVDIASLTNIAAVIEALDASLSSLASHTTNTEIHVTAGEKAGWDAKADASITNGLATTAAPVWISVSNAIGAVTITNDFERPVTLYATGDVTVAFAGLRPPLPVWLEAWAEGTATVSFADAYAVGGFLWQTNRVNLFAVWASGTNTFITPVTTRSKE